ncbi:exportin-T-like, partial [Penaeus monodon]|uniref:exportin-T-like n=1 Tax=Penaeus monodon TaxID=6687 RepID=UPI0018A731F1
WSRARDGWFWCSAVDAQIVVCLDGRSLMHCFLLHLRLFFIHLHHNLTEYLHYQPDHHQVPEGDQSISAEHLCPTCVCNLLSPLRTIEENDEEERRTRRLLQRNYYLFLTTIVSNNLLDVMASLDSNIFNQVLMSVVQGAVEFPDPVAQKNCFVILRRLTEAWGDKDTGPPGFLEFLYTQVVPACFLAPLKTTLI